MDKNKESAVSPAIAVILIVAMTCLMAAIAGVVFLGMADMSVSDKRVSMIVDIEGGKITMTPVYNSAVDILNGYTTYLSIIYDEQVYSFYPGTVHVIDSEGKFDIMDLSFIKIIGHFSDGSDEIIFTGRVVDGKIVSTGETEKCYITFTKYGGIEEVRTVSVYKGCTASALPFDLKNPENTIDGWYTDNDLTVKWDFEEQVTKNITLYAQEYYPYFTSVKSYTSLQEFITAINSWKIGTIQSDGTICKDIPLEGGAITINGDLSLKGGDFISTTDSGLGYPTDRKPHIWASPKGVSGNLINLNGGTLNVGGNLIIDGNGKMTDSIIKLMNSNSYLNINSGELTVQNGNSNGNGGGIWNYKGTINVGSKLTVSGNIATNYGGGICNEGGTITNSNSDQIHLENNKATNGGGIWSSTGKATVANDDYYKINVVASGNTATYGGGVYNTGRNVTINGKISGNTATTGGGVYNSGGSVKINSEISGNIVTNYGGGIYNTGSDVEINGVISSLNTATSGGGICNAGVNVTINGKISGNTATYGGGVYNKDGSVKINSEISGNTATNKGGGIYTGYQSEISGTVTGNSAKEGGGIYNTGTMTAISLTVSNNGKGIEGNYKTINGGGIYNSGKIYLNYDDVDSLKNSIYNNIATTRGGGIWSSSSDNVYNSGTPVSNLEEQIKEWFQNDVGSNPPNTASEGNNYYPGL